MKNKYFPTAIALLLVAILFTAPLPTALAGKAPTAQLPSHQVLLREIYKELIEINTTDATGSTTRAAEAMAARLKAAGFPAADVQVLVHPGNARKGNLVARMRGTGARKPLLLLAHLDVVEARREDWSGELDPFTLNERDGYFYGRGTIDDKAMAAIFIANLIRYKQEGFRPDRDIIVALTADEEGGDFNGVEWLLKNHRDLIDAEYGINEGGGGRQRQGKPLFHGIQASEKVYQSFLLEVKNRGGHSSLPVKDNAIYHLAAGLNRLSQFDFPVNLNEVTRAYFGRMSAIETGQVAADMKAVAATAGAPDPATVSRLAASPFYNALMRTTCVATRLEAGHAENALPQTARATVNCRILPQESADEVQRTLIGVLADERIKVSPVQEPKPSPPSPLRPEVIQPIESITNALWPGVPVIPVMSTGATDSLYFRQAGIPMYGVSGLFSDIDDNRAHGKDERLGVKELYEGQEFLYRLVKTLSSGTAGAASQNHADDRRVEVERLIAEMGAHTWRGAFLVAEPAVWEYNFTEPMLRILKIGPAAQEPLLAKLSDPKIRDQVIILLGGIGDERAVGPIINAMVSPKDLKTTPHAESINKSANLALTNITVADVIWYHGGGIVIDRCPRDPKKCWSKWWEKNRATFSVGTITQSRLYSNYPDYGIYKQR